MKTKLVYLRALEPDDIDLLYKWENDPEIWDISNNLAPYSKHTLAEYIKSAHLDIFTVKQLRLMIVNTDDNSAIGTIDFFEFDPQHQRAGIGVLIDKNFRRNGCATDALKLMIRYAFQTLKLHQLFCNISVNNESSIRLFTKAGFQICGTKKEWNNIKGKWEDEHMLQLINKSILYSKN